MRSGGRGGRDSPIGRKILGFIAGLLILFGFLAMVLSAATWNDADRAERAPVCASPDVTGYGEDCVDWTGATIVSYVSEGGKRPHYSITVQDPSASGELGDSYMITFGSHNALLADDRVGTTVQVEKWHGDPIAVKAGSLVVRTEDNPLVERTYGVAGALLCFGLGSFAAATTLGFDEGGALSGGSFAAASFLRRRRGSFGGFATVCRVGVICWSVPAVVTAFVLLKESAVVGAAFALAAGVTELSAVLAVGYLTIVVLAQRRARRRELALLTWLSESTRQLLDATREAGPDRGCWVWWGDTQSPRTCGAAARHQVYEVAVHTYDAQIAAGAAQELPDEVAVDGIEEFLSTCGTTTVAWPYEAATVDVRVIDGPTWRVTLSADGASMSQLPKSDAASATGDLAGPGSATAFVKGTANDLMLAFYDRIPMTSVELGGDVHVIDLLRDWDMEP